MTMARLRRRKHRSREEKIDKQSCSQGEIAKKENTTGELASRRAMFQVLANGFGVSKHG